MAQDKFLEKLTLMYFNSFVLVPNAQIIVYLMRK